MGIKTTDWFPPAGITITHATTNNQQVLIALSNLSVVYFEIDATDDQLIEYQDRLEIATTITAMAIQENISEKVHLQLLAVLMKQFKWSRYRNTIVLKSNLTSIIGE